MNSSDKWQEELEQLRSIIAKTGLTETTKWGGPVFTHKGKNILSFAGFKNHFVLVFFQGVFLQDPYKVLQSAQEGKAQAKAMRHWRFTSGDQVNEKQVLEYIKEAIKNADEGKEHKPERSEPVPMPPQLQEALVQDKTLRAAFEALAPYQQRLYKEHIATAKQESTKYSRLEKIKPMILQGVGLHDKYKNS